MYQRYETEVLSEYILEGNDAMLRCLVPSFVSDFVTVVGWVDNQGNMFQKNNLEGKQNIWSLMISYIKRHKFSWLKLVAFCNGN